jgi:UDP-3-O-[3-hydroxymyristoyl] glucosamine N-acyltransferase
MITRTVAELAQLCDAELEGDGARVVEGPASLSEATPREISFYAHPKYRHQLAETRAAAVLVKRGVDVPRHDLAVLRCADPSAAFTRVIRAFVAAEPPPAPGIHPSAVVDRSAEIASDASIGPLCIVGARVRIGPLAVLHPHVVLERDVDVGASTVMHACAVAYAGVRIGARCLIHAGAVIGADGYGFEPGRSASEGWVKIPQCGTVVIEDDVEIGANAAIDRGRFGATRIGRGAKLDNLVHIGHNVVIGEGALLVAQVGIAGSCRIGERAVLAGKVGVNGHVDIGAGARLGAQSGVLDDVPPGADYVGWPARPRKETWRQVALMQRLPELVERVHALETQAEGVRALETNPERVHALETNPERVHALETYVERVRALEARLAELEGKSQ